jgi:general transcription factor 3C polypeptide 3 (transcription factor C subunit 4)
MDYPEDVSGQAPSSGEFAYPDIDETIQYPWQGSQPPASGEPVVQSVIDPRLYRGLFTGSESQAPEQAHDDRSGLDDSGEDSSFELSSSEEESTLVAKCTKCFLSALTELLQGRRTFR